MKNNSTTQLLSFLTLTLVLASCDMELGERGNGELITETRDVTDFDDVRLMGNFEVILQESNSPGVIITTDENLMELIETVSSSGTLEIRSKRKLRPSENSKVVIKYKNLKEIEIAGAASLKSENIIRGRDLAIHMSGAGNVDLALELRDLIINMSGAGAVEVEGNVEEQEINLSGAGGYDAENLISKNCEVTISGVGGATIHATESIKANVSGIGGVKYFGNPANVQSDVSGLGSVKAADD